ncbi:MAG: histidinol-phosphate aminotransferase family protein [Lachnospiraceae bacterium]|nr:histidinol-phosphate aminotransferase family protein [Lachnospiraceae bacterium]
MLVYICNPNNPTGTLIDSDSLEIWIKEFPETLFVIDEAYSEFSGVSMNQSTLKYENLLVTHTMSKAFGLANFRFGYLVASEKNIQKISDIRNAKNISTITQVAVLAALKDKAYVMKYVKEVNRAKDELITRLKKTTKSVQYRVFSSRANFFIIKFNDEKIKKIVHERLADFHIYVRDLVHGSPVENSLRITVGTRAQMDVFYEKFVLILKELEGERVNGR